MRKKLTDLLVKRAEPRKTLTLIWDTEEPGLVLKVTPAGKKIFTLISASFPGKWEVTRDGKRVFRPKKEGEPRHQSKRTPGRVPLHHAGRGQGARGRVAAAAGRRRGPRTT